MKMERMSTDPSGYLVLDVETNGIRSEQHDLLSVSVFQPDTGRTYERFLPLELNSEVLTTDINGIRKKDLKNQKPLTQDEVNQFLDDFDVDHRILLHYGTLDERFIRSYFRRHDLIGFSRMHFFNFKKRICVSQYADITVSKDNLCKALGIEGVSEVHSGINDCILEWKLFEKMDGDPLLITQCGMKFYGVFSLKSDYVIPVSFLQAFPNLSRLVRRPEIEAEAEEVYRLTVKGKNIRRFGTNISGMTIEHLIDTMLDLKKDEQKELSEQMWMIANKRKLPLLGKIPREAHVIPLLLNRDGSVTAANPEDRKAEEEINRTQKAFKKKLVPLVDFIQHDIFQDRPVRAQELVVNRDAGIMALCDLSSPDAVLEIKSGPVSLNYYKEQLYYEAAGRQIYILGMDWSGGSSGVEISIQKVTVHAAEPVKKKQQVSYVGRVKRMNCGLNAAVVEDYGFRDLTVRFEDGMVKHHITRQRFDRGNVDHDENAAEDAFQMVKKDWHHFMELPDKLRTRKILKVCFTGAYASDCTWNGKGRGRILFPYRDADSTRDTVKNIRAFIRSVPEELLGDNEIIEKTASALGLRDFFRLYPVKHVSADIMEELFSKRFYGQDYSIFPEKSTPVEFWRYVYEHKDMKKRKTRPHGFPKELRTRWKNEKNNNERGE